MTRDDYIWIGVRLFGVYLLVRAIMSGVGLASNLSSALVAERLRESNVDAAADMADKLFYTALATSASSAVSCVLYLLAAVYLLRGGALVFRLVAPPRA